MSDVTAPFLRTILVLPARDLHASIAWYRETLGFECVYVHEGDGPDEPDNYAILRRDGAVFHLILDEEGHEMPAWARAGVGYLYVLVEDVDAVLAAVEAKGVPLARGLATEVWGSRAFLLEDPAGNSVRVEASG